MGVQQYFRKGKNGKDTVLGFLDDFPGAYRAYSTRKIYTSYEGPCLRLTKDNISFQDISFLSNGFLDEVAIVDFCGSDEGYISVFYDQSGNGHNMVLNTFSRAPLIYTGASVVKHNGVPSPYYNNDIMQDTSFATIELRPKNNISIFYCIKTEELTGQIWFSSPNQFGLAAQNSTNTGWNQYNNTPNFYKNKNLQSISNRLDVLNSVSPEAVISELNVDISNWTGGSLNMGRQTVTQAFRLIGNLNDFIIFDETKSLPDMQEISDLINLPYQIY